MPTPPSAASDGIARSADLGRQTRPVHSGQAGDSAAMLMEQVVQRENLLAAYERVRANKGAAGVDGMTVDDLADFCRGHWPRIREQKAAFEALDEWLRRKLRCIVWRQWRRARTCFKELCRAGLDRVRAAASAYHGHGPWWNAGASHMNQALPTRTLRDAGLLSLLEEHRRLACAI